MLRLHAMSLHVHLCTLMPTEKPCMAPSCTPTCSYGVSPATPLRMPQAVCTHPYTLTLIITSHPVHRTHTTLVQSHFFTLVLSAGGSTHTYTSTLTRTHTCTHTTFTPQSLGPQLPRPRAAQPDGPGDSWWEKMSSGCSDGRSHTGMSREEGSKRGGGWEDSGGMGTLISTLSPFQESREQGVWKQFREGVDLPEDRPGSQHFGCSSRDLVH